MSEAKNVIEFIQDEKDMTTSRIYCESVYRVIVNVLSATVRNIKNLFILVNICLKLCNS